MSYTNIKDFENIRNKKVLFIDLETTGLVKTPFGLPPETKFPNYKSEEYNSARILSIGWLYMEDFDYDYDIKLENINERIIKPNGFIIPEDSIKIHQITQEITDIKGRPIKKILKYIANIINECDYIIGYNVFFDFNILLSELYRVKLKNTIQKMLDLQTNKKILCVGILSSLYAKPDNWKPNITNKYQIPKQIDAYKKCFDNYPENAHNAKSDVFAMIKIIFWICHRHIKL